MKKLVNPLIAVLIALTLSSASRVVASPATTTTRLVANLKGSNERGSAGAPQGTGIATVRIIVGSRVKNQLCYTLRVSGFKLPAIAAHIHSGKAGTNGGIVVPFPTAPGKNGRAAGCTAATTSLLRAIAAHPTSYYVNVHTAAYPNGAVRGQLGM